MPHLTGRPASQPNPAAVRNLLTRRTFVGIASGTIGNLALPFPSFGQTAFETTPPIPGEFADRYLLRMDGFLTNCDSYERLLEHARALRRLAVTDENYVKTVAADHRRKLSSLRVAIKEAKAAEGEVQAMKLLNQIGFVTSTLFTAASFLIVVGSFPVSASGLVILAGSAFLTTSIIDGYKTASQKVRDVPRFLVSYYKNKGVFLAESVGRYSVFVNVNAAYDIFDGLTELSNNERTLNEIRYSLVKLTTEASKVEAILSRYPGGDIAAWRTLILSELDVAVGGLDKFLTLHRATACMVPSDIGPTLKPLGKA